MGGEKENRSIVNFWMIDRSTKFPPRPLPLLWEGRKKINWKVGLEAPTYARSGCDLDFRDCKLLNIKDLAGIWMGTFGIN